MYLLWVQALPPLKQRDKGSSPWPEKTLGSTLVHFSSGFKALQGSADGNTHHPSSPKGGVGGSFHDCPLQREVH